MLKLIQGLNKILQERFYFVNGFSIANLSQNYVKVFLLKTYVTVHKFDIICLFETYVDSSALPDDRNLEIVGYDIACADQPTKTKRGGVCIYNKKCLPLRVLNIVLLNEI